MKLEVGKTYITQGGYLVKIVDHNSYEYYYYAGKCHSPGLNSLGKTVDEISRTEGRTWSNEGWAWNRDGTITLNEEWSEKLKIIKEAPFKIPECPDGYRWAGGYPQIVTPNIGDYVLSYSADDSFGWVPYIADESILLCIANGENDICIGLEKITATPAAPVTEKKKPMWRMLKPGEKVKLGDYYSAKSNQRELTEEEFLNSDKRGWMEVEYCPDSHHTESNSMAYKRLVEENPTWRMLGPDEIVQQGDLYTSRANHISFTEDEFLNSGDGGWLPVDNFSSSLGKKGNHQRFYFKRRIDSDSTELSESPQTPEKEVKPSEVVSQETTPQEIVPPVGYRRLLPDEYPQKGDIPYFNGKYDIALCSYPKHQVKNYPHLLFFRQISKEQTMKTLASRALTYFVTEPAVTLGKPIVKSLRYVLFVGMLTTLGYGVANPTAVTNAVKKYTPKVTIEMPK